MIKKTIAISLYSEVGRYLIKNLFAQNLHTFSQLEVISAFFHFCALSNLKQSASKFLNLYNLIISCDNELTFCIKARFYLLNKLVQKYWRCNKSETFIIQCISYFYNLYGHNRENLIQWTNIHLRLIRSKSTTEPSNMSDV